MNRNWKKAVASVLVLALIAVLSFGCAKKAEEKVVITIGEITDLTGPGSPAVIPLYYCLQDVVRYYNEEDLIPGVELDIVTWDNRYDPAREVPGYDWVREKGAELVVVVIPQSGVLLKPFADKDKIPIASLSTHKETFEPPGWVFNMSNSSDMHVKTLMKWISEEHWTGEGPAKIGMAGWSEPMILAMEEAMEEYCQEHPDEFEYAGTYKAPFGTPTWGHEVGALKDCDYISAVGFPMGSFIEEFQRRGYSATFIDASAGAASYRGFFVDMLGYEALDGTLTSNSYAFWSDDTPIVSLAKELLDRYRPGQAEEIIYAGLAYVGGIGNLAATFQILQNAIEKVGAENFDGQAYYDAAVKYRIGGPLFEGYPEWGFSEPKRYLVDHLLIQEFSAEDEDIVSLSDWLPLVK